ncbi:MAG: sulfotransferase [Leptolyngbyaceae cyanobacterium MO_188.B28]|nr:sulfotransferase [Leptolyngbyaceae cyanobacterium MO_188.B28]
MSSLFHPLCGADLRTLSQLFTTNGFVSPNQLPQASIALAFSLLRWPFSTSERAMMGLSRRRQAPMKPPVFIVGYWRSGTTHLHNLLSQVDEFGYISPLATGLPWDILGIVRTFEPLLELALPSDRYVDNVAVKPNSPQEDSIALASMASVSYYHGLYFPKHFKRHFNRGVFFDGCDASEIDQWRRRLVHLLEKVSIHQDGKQLLIKNPVYTAHISKLRAIWPEAKFIHIYRNPYVVFPSTRHFFTRLLPELTLQTYDPEQFDALVSELILDSYPPMMNALRSDSANLPADSFVEVRFEDLETNPLAELEKIYQAIGLPGFAQARPNFETYLASIQGYRKNRYSFDPETIQSVEAHWAALIKRWGYTPPSPPN